MKTEEFIYLLNETDWLQYEDSKLYPAWGSPIKEVWFIYYKTMNMWRIEGWDSPPYLKTTEQALELYKHYEE